MAHASIFKVRGKIMLYIVTPGGAYMVDAEGEKFLF